MHLYRGWCRCRCLCRSRGWGWGWGRGWGRSFVFGLWLLLFFLLPAVYPYYPDCLGTTDVRWLLQPEALGRYPVHIRVVFDRRLTDLSVAIVACRQSNATKGFLLGSEGAEPRKLQFIHGIGTSRLRVETRAARGYSAWGSALDCDRLAIIVRDCLLICHFHAALGRLSISAPPSPTS